MMTEREAWQEKATDWLNAKEIYDGKYATMDGTGVCLSVGDMRGRVSDETLASMKEKLAKHLPRSRGELWPHRWATNRHGARSRALFCLRMATLCPGDDTKITTAREAWFFLARCWLQAKPGTSGLYCPVIGNHPSRYLGVCLSIGVLLVEKTIDKELYLQMEQTIQDHLPKPCGYCWSHNRHGARSRTLFCLRMAGLSK